MATQNAVAEQRVALVIGNGAYEFSPLINPVNDAKAMAESLKRLDFDVIEGIDLTQREMTDVIREFGGRIRDGGVGLFYFAGHGVEIRGANYLIPIRSDIEYEEDVADLAVNVNAVLRRMEAAGNRLNIIILDACRNNPFARSFRTASSGLARINAPSGSIIAYATAPGKVAADGNDDNGLFTGELLDAMEEPGLRIEDIFKRVRSNVERRSGGSQLPWTASALKGDFYFNEAPAASQVATAPPPATTAPRPGGVEEMVFWQAIKGSEDAPAFEAYLRQFPDGVFADLARMRIRQARDTKSVGGPTETPPAVPASPAAVAPLTPSASLTEETAIASLLTPPSSLAIAPNAITIDAPPATALVAPLAPQSSGQGQAPAAANVAEPPTPVTSGQVAQLPKAVPPPTPPSFMVDAMDAIMVARKNSNVRGGPSTDHEKVAFLNSGVTVEVTGRVRGRNWYRILAPGGTTGFVYGNLLAAVPPPQPTPVAVAPAAPTDVAAVPSPVGNWQGEFWLDNRLTPSQDCRDVLFDGGDIKLQVQGDKVSGTIQTRRNRRTLVKWSTSVDPQDATWSTNVSGSVKRGISVNTTVVMSLVGDLQSGRGEWRSNLGACSGEFQVSKLR